MKFQVGEFVIITRVDYFWLPPHLLGSQQKIKGYNGRFYTLEQVSFSVLESQLRHYTKLDEILL